jgi:sugar-specific transcriptional regulator TrmB
MSLKNPKKIICVLATSGPKTKWRIMEKTGLPYPRVHEVIKRLKQEGFVQGLSKKRSAKNLLVIPYGLTFKGVLTYGNQVVLEPPARYRIGKRNLEEFKKEYIKDYNKFLKDEESFIEFLEDYGKLLKYPIFSEIRWLTKKFRKGFILNTVQKISRSIVSSDNVNSSTPIQTYRKQLKELKKEKSFLEKKPFLQRLTGFESFGKGSKKELEIDTLKGVKERLEIVEMQMKTFSQLEDKWLQQRFAFMFFHQITFFRKIAERNEGNKRLYRFAEELLNVRLKHEIEPLRKVLSVFEEGKK